MQKYKCRSDGFHVFAVLAVLLVVGLVGMVGMRVFHLQKDSKTKGQSISKTARSALQTVPPNWRVYGDKSAAVQFIYPKELGVFATEKTIGDYAAAQTSGRLTTSTIPGVTGAFSLKTYKKGIREVKPGRSSPTIELIGNEWVVSRSSELDAKQYKTGDIYAEMNRSNFRGLEVYSTEAGDEGVVSYNLYFVTGDRLRVLELPPFDSEQYTSTYNINDRGAYDAMYQQVRGSIRLY